MTGAGVRVVTRFAPSPTGPLHLGHAYAALFAARAAAEAGGRFLVRIEDIDSTRARPEFEAGILADLAWLGLAWEQPVRRQSEYMADYAGALKSLETMGLIYPCFCSRRAIRAEVRAAGEAPHGALGQVYPGTCRRLDQSERRRRREAGQAFALRLDMARAAALAGRLRWRDRDLGVVEARPEAFGDVVLARKETPASYHLAVVIDDHLQGVTLVTRGADLVPATDVQRLLQALLGLTTPDYHHHRLITDDEGRRLAKRDKPLTLAALRESGCTPEEVRRRLGFA